MSEPTSAAGAAAARPAPLQPPLSSPLTLTAPEPPHVVAQTQAPALAPAVDAAALPGLDAKVDDYISSLMAADTSNRLLQVPVKALNEGGLSKGSKVGATLLELRRTVEDLDPKGATGTRHFAH